MTDPKRYLSAPVEQPDPAVRLEPRTVAGYASCAEPAKAPESGGARGDQSTVTGTNADTRTEPTIGAIVETADHGRERVMDVIAKTVFLRPVGGGYERTVSLAGFWREISW